ncbi:MAG TPA: hypothetical protein P5084_05345 [Paludibacter sp.]|nr:hypothetical protein [Paludibacter sp.]
MKTTKYIYTVLTVLVTSVFATANAQTTIPNDKNVTVEREYKPVIQDAGKINSVPEVLDPNVTKQAAKYSEINLPMTVGQNIQPIPAAELELQRRRNARPAFVRLGMGNGLNSMADIFLPVISKEDILLDLKLNHLGTFGTKAHSNSNMSLTLDKYYKNADIYAGIGLGHEYLKYYGKNYNYGSAGGDISEVNLSTVATNYGNESFTEQDLVRINRTAQSFKLNEIANSPSSDVFWRFNTFFGVRSLPNTSKIMYNAEVKFKSFDSKNGLTENIIHSKAGLNSQNGSHRVGVDFELINLLYKSDNAAVLNFWDAYSVFVMNPYYSLELANFNLRLGVKSSFSFIHGRAFNPSPDIHAEWRVVPKLVALYAGASGEYKVNSLNEMFTENRYLYSDLRVKDTYTPFNFYGGIKLKPVYNLLIDGYINYQMIDNQYFFVNKEYASTTVPGQDSVIFTNKFNVTYSGASLLKVGLRANYNIFNFINVELKGAYNNWTVNSEDFAWNKPVYEASFSTDIKITNNFNVSGNVFVEGERFAKFGDKTMKMSPIVDVNLAASYSYSNWFTLFAKANNLLNSHYQHFYGYEVQGINVLAGVAFSW